MTTVLGPGLCDRLELRLGGLPPEFRKVLLDRVHLIEVERKSPPLGKSEQVLVAESDERDLDPTGRSGGERPKRIGKSIRLPRDRRTPLVHDRVREPTGGEGLERITSEREAAPGEPEAHSDPDLDLIRRESRIAQRMADASVDRVHHPRAAEHDDRGLVLLPRGEIESGADERLALGGSPQELSGEPFEVVGKDALGEAKGEDGIAGRAEVGPSAKLPK